MCGVAGVFVYKKSYELVSEDELNKVSRHMKSRGPDDNGCWYSKDHKVGLAHRRLSIIDLTDKAKQPMAKADHGLVISFNGEIYNYREIRKGLQNKGYEFSTNSDTEVILNLYRDKGLEMFSELRGMFAFSLWDGVKKRLLLARDHLGIKPFYYSDNGSAIRFSSQVKALVAGGGVSHAKSPGGVVGFYLLGSVPEPFTIYESIKAVPAGSYICVSASGVAEPATFFRVSDAFNATSPVSGSSQRNHCEESIKASLRESLKYHLEADVPVGVFLSAGLDSAALTGMMADFSAGPIHTITLGFDEFKGSADDEAPDAEQLAAFYGTKHTTRRINSKEFRADLPLILEAMDQPTIDGINSWFVSKAAKEQGLKVAISGVGGDELFGGYPSFTDIPKWRSMVQGPRKLPFFSEAFKIAGYAVAKRTGSINPKLPGLFQYANTNEGAYLLKRGLFMPWELDSLLDSEFVEIGLKELENVKMFSSAEPSKVNSSFSQIATLEAENYMKNQLLRDVDWASMAHSLEIRVPLVDPFLWKKVMPILDSETGRGIGKEILGFAPNKTLPLETRNRPKTGFSTPIKQWLEPVVAERSQKQKDQKTIVPLSTWARRWSKHIVGSGVFSNR
jgi:asparagine synthase (glutamine-hydrolysing)